MNEARLSPGTSASSAAGARTRHTLDELRAQLDKVDETLSHLVAERMALASAIAEAKGPGAPVIRPDREAEVLAARLSAEPDVPPVLIASVWRALTSASCRAQRPYKVHVTQASAEAALSLHPAAPVLSHAGASAALSALQAHPGDLAVLHERDAPWDTLGDAHALAAADTARGRVVVFGGSDVESANGPYALTRTADGVQISDHAPADAPALARIHLFPVPLPVSVTVS